MKYNCTLKNSGALPIPYIVKCGEHLSIRSMFKDSPVFLNIQFITATLIGQFEIRCAEQTIIVAPNPDLTILPDFGTSVPETATAPDGTKQD